MLRKKAKDEVELAFGLKQFCVLALLTGLVLGGTFFWGYEAGHERALRGEPSLLGFLEKSADPLAEPVAIPKVLLDQFDEDRANAVSPATRRARPSPSKPAAVPTRIEPASASRAGSASNARIKPRPAVMPKAEGPPDRPPPAAAASPSPVLPAASSGDRIHFQVAALGVRKNAKSLVDWLRSEGFPARIQPARSDGLYRVYVGPFRNDADAASAKAQLAKDGFKLMAREF